MAEPDNNGPIPLSVVPSRSDATAQAERFGHAALDLGSRNAKARKIDRLLDLHSTGRTLRVLEVGTGSGGIAHYFATHSRLSCDVDAVDVEDCRQVSGGYRFAVVADVRLPFGDQSFDAVISNHVIEHVGDEMAQSAHLRELRRVLKNDGIGYLAVPNRWQVVEPHYRLAFLSWLPTAWRTPYLRMMKRGVVYDCRPLTVPELEKQLFAASFDFVQEHGRALRITFEIERPRALAYRAFIRWVPDRAFEPMRKLFPTLIYVLHPRLP
jgi:phosphatidyl-myo-inositol dimannoside synthase